MQAEQVLGQGAAFFRGRGEVARTCAGQPALGAEEGAVVGLGIPQQLVSEGSPAPGLVVFGGQHPMQGLFQLVEPVGVEGEHLQIPHGHAGVVGEQQVFHRGGGLGADPGAHAKVICADLAGQERLATHSVRPPACVVGVFRGHIRADHVGPHEKLPLDNLP